MIYLTVKYDGPIPNITQILAYLNVCGFVLVKDLKDWQRYQFPTLPGDFLEVPKVQLADHDQRVRDVLNDISAMTNTSPLEILSEMLKL